MSSQHRVPVGRFTFYSQTLIASCRWLSFSALLWQLMQLQLLHIIPLEKQSQYLKEPQVVVHLHHKYSIEQGCQTFGSGARFNLSDLEGGRTNNITAK